MSEQTVNDQVYFSSRLAGYKIVNQQVKSDDADVTYFGFINRRGYWYIMKRDNSDGGAGIKTYEYIQGSSLYSTNWTNRESLTYVLFDEAFA